MADLTPTDADVAAGRTDDGSRQVGIVGLGTDLVEIGRFRRVLERTPGMVDRLFTPAERRYSTLRADPTERFAARFAAKEAVLKSLGLGIGAMRFRDIEVARAESGEPSIVLHGSAAVTAHDRGVVDWKLSISHTDHLAQAVVIACGVCG